MIAILVVSSCFVIPIQKTAIPKNALTIVLDAGHGGYDGGMVGGTTGQNEMELNLKYAFCLKSYLEDMGVSVIMTRTNNNGLYGMFSTNKKMDDMLARKKIIDNNNPDLVLSIHMNSFPLKSSRGAQAFFKEKSESSKTLAIKIQECLQEQLPYGRELALKGDYYILNCTDVPSAIVECGFLSCPEEEAMLVTKEYMQQVCYAILCGIVNYLTTA